MAVIDLTNAPTVQDYIKQHRKDKIWLCPSIVSNSKLAVDPILRGIDCTPSTVPEEIRGKLVRRSYIEGGALCIIWENNEDVRSELYGK